MLMEWLRNIHVYVHDQNKDHLNIIRGVFEPQLMVIGYFYEASKNFAIFHIHNLHQILCVTCLLRNCDFFESILTVEIKKQQCRIKNNLPVFSSPYFLIFLKLDSAKKTFTRMSNCFKARNLQGKDFRSPSLVGWGEESYLSVYYALACNLIFYINNISMTRVLWVVMILSWRIK